MDLGIGSRVRHKELGVGIVIQNTTEDLIITFVNHGVKEIAKTEAIETLDILEEVEPRKDMVSLSVIEERLNKILGSVAEEQLEVDLGDKWVDGTLVFKPGNPELKPYEMSVETFFHKIVMVRDKLRVMEQRINSSNLSDEEKVNLEQYITKIYGSLTSFNILFDTREHGFIGSGG